MEDINERSVIRPSEVPVQLSLKLTEDKVLEIVHAFIREVMNGEPRPQQDQMIRAVWRALQNDSKEVFDAPTGTGKSIALMVCLIAGKRTVITTGTKALQDQYLRDAPKFTQWLFEHYGIERRVHTLKGRSAYVCLENLQDMRLTVSDADRRKVLEWLEGDARGEWDSGPWLPASVRSELSSTADQCLGKGCDFFADCYSYRAKEEAAQAHLVVANHALLGVNVASGGMILPDHDAIFVDECHQLDAFVADALGVEFRFNSKGETERGTIAAAISATRSLLPELNVLDGMSTILPELRKYLTMRHEAIKAGRIRTPDFPGGIADVDAELWGMLAGMARLASDAARALDTLSIMATDKKTQARREKALRQMGNISSGINRMARAEPGQTVYLTNDGDTILLRMVDVRVGEALDECAWHNADEDSPRLGMPRSAVMCSGTVPPRYQHEVGMSDATLHDIGSPFDYQSTTLIYVPNHLTAPSGKGGNANLHDREARGEAMKLIEAAISRNDRGVLCLTTSIETSKRWAEDAQQRFNIPILNPTRAEEKNAVIAEAMGIEGPFVIFASQGWFEGVDMPGRLNLVIVDKAPMAPPTDPILNAKQSLAGDKAFGKVVVPYVAAKLGQAAGRLMRRHGDGGVIAILDPRMRNAGWTGKPAARTGLWAKLPPAPNTTSLNEALEFLRTGTRAQVPAPLEFAPAAPRRAPSVVPLGRYAVVLEDGETALYEVSMGEGVLEGLRVADRIVERRKAPTRRPESITALRLIAEQGIEESAARYGQITEECGQCHRKLTDPESIAIGIGPDCRRKMLAEAAA